MELFKNFRDPLLVKKLLKAIEKTHAGKPVKIMEVCGGHTHAIMRYGLNKLLGELGIEFLHGPGCPVCVMPKERIDQAIAIARQPGVILTTYGDMMRVPGSESSLIKERSLGRDIRMVYSPLESLEIAKRNPEKLVVFFAIGFETTTPMTAGLLELAIKEGIKNLLVHVNHVLVIPAMEAVIKESEIKAFIGPGHVSAIIGGKAYKPFVEKYKVPVVISGFEPVDILEGVLLILNQLKEGRAEVEIQYSRAVTWEGNIRAQELMAKYFEPREKFRWRGLGDIPFSSLKLKGEYSQFDAEIYFKYILPHKSSEDHKLCICGEILKGKAKPTDCKIFGTACTPKNPLGSCMVSSEGACAAYYKYIHSLVSSV
ncbi:MAG TPA: hydrogenase formation protein HypD [Aquifex aeolicus]|uniref:Hydrogenase formation protein HypD n=1 Tax=Aquifex aeolicus TaxID=63363 RepID=A0A9D0YNW7_AQUAO|nr:hydrogenase formation protein HypD [Aquifex aeolicus]